ncbi:hypothetical protein [Polyangium jinanense]|uniref:Uncharacterized protein n=1 Tax=Polyangium jinanense TaxID=2829994 RepID=A0A9X3XDX4_9BACT|nr:hypothetical protein [Polyangium jinanense]MDC3988517.1 hypothetical protein [Polyangium jinanense]
MQWAWVGFDVGLTVGMFFLAARWRRSIGALLAVAVSLDAAVMLVEVLVYNVPRASGPLVLTVLAVACGAPALAAAVLWGALERRGGISE